METPRISEGYRSLCDCGLFLCVDKEPCTDITYNGDCPRICPWGISGFLSETLKERDKQNGKRPAEKSAGLFFEIERVLGEI